MSSGTQQGAVIRVKGLPPKATAEDVLEFFATFSLGPGAVHLVSKERRSAGEALVEFPSLEDAQRACLQDKDIFLPKYGNRYVRVLLADITPAELHSSDVKATESKAGRNGRRGQGDAETVAKVAGLPPGITLQELLQLFWGLQAKPASTHIMNDNKGGPVEAYVDFESSEHAQQAIKSRNGTMMTTAAGMFQLSVQRVSKAEWESVVSSRQRSDGILRLKGLPTRATAKDVQAFFEGYGIKKDGVHVQPQSENRHSKVAYVEFVSPDEAVRALARDRQRFGEAFGDRYCLLQLVTRQEMEVGRQQFTRNGGSSSSSGPSSSNGNGSGNGSGASPAQITMMGPLGMLPPGGMPAVFPPAAAAAGMLFGVPGAMPGLAAAPGLAGPLGAVPAAAPAHMVAAAAGGMQMPFGGLGMGHGAVPAVPGQHPGLPPVNLAAAGALPAAAAAAAAAGGVSWGGPAAARYMVQDLSTGQRLFLDPRFNVSFNPTDLPVAGNLAPWLQAQSQQSMSISEHSQPVHGAERRGQQAMFPPHPFMGMGFAGNGSAAMDGQLAGLIPGQGQGDGSGGSSNTANGNGSGSGSDGRDASDGSGSDGDGNGSSGQGSDPGSSGGSRTNVPAVAAAGVAAGAAAHPGAAHPHPHLHAHHHHQQQHQHLHAHHHALGPGLPPAFKPPHTHSHHPSAHTHHAHAHPQSAPLPGTALAAQHAQHAHGHHPHVQHPQHAQQQHHTLKHAASRASNTQDPLAAAQEAALQPLPKRCRSQE